MRGLFVTATDTGVGKTTVACALAAMLAQDGRRVAVCKPCETGGGDDAERLLAAAGLDLDPARVRPYALALPASPEEAARRAGVRIALERLVDTCRAVAEEADFLLVEGAGGLLVPITPEADMADLAVRLELPLLVVARPGLGTVNHTLLTLEAAARRGLKVAAFVFSRASAADEPLLASNAAAIAQRSGTSFLGTLPFLADPSPPTLARAARDAFDLDILHIITDT
jgi:dethiobiotin synthetase